MLDMIKVDYKHTSIPYLIHQYLREIDHNHKLIACDFETANKCSSKEMELLQVRYNLKPSLSLLQQIEATGLSHPSLTVITHLSIAWSDRDAIVIVCDTDLNRRIVYNWLISTDCVQLWHNLSFDGKYIVYHTGRLPKNYEDTQLYTKTLVNDADNQESLTGLKHLMGNYYGDWALTEDIQFTLENMYDPRMIKYAAIDACATYKLYQLINEQLASV